MTGQSRNFLLTGVIILVGNACAPRANMFTDMPRARPLPTARSVDDLLTPPEQRIDTDLMRPIRRPPDAVVTAREPYSRFENRFNAVWARLDPGPSLDWGLLSIAVVF